MSDGAVGNDIVLELSEPRTIRISELLVELAAVLATSGDGLVRIGSVPDGEAERPAPSDAAHIDADRLSGVRPHGWVLVPGVATHYMLEASILRRENAHRDYMRMISEAPKIDPARADCVRPVEGGVYVQRNGEVVGPMRLWEDPQFPFTDGNYGWRADGSISAYAGRDDGSACGMDLVSVHVAEENVEAA